ncbi:MAG: proteasome subunit beta [Actinomycetia bacterium]|nr:proteasome subunit beta [Actinomycetes bacterium]
MLPTSFTQPGSSSFSDFLAQQAPHLLPGGRAVAADGLDGQIPHGTTIVAVAFPGGVAMGGDRRATMGSMIAQRDVDKVHAGDEYSAIGFAGSAGFGFELVRLFQVELEHYEKIEGTTLSTDGKANRLSTLVRGHLSLAMQGLAVVPLFAGYDSVANAGRIFTYDPTGGRHEESEFAAVGSGSIFARGSIKKLYRDDMSERDAVTAIVQALYDAADDDSATGGPDITRRIFPVVAAVTADGFNRWSTEDTAAVADEVIGGRMQRPDGPNAPLV